MEEQPIEPIAGVAEKSEGQQVCHGSQVCHDLPVFTLTLANRKYEDSKRNNIREIYIVDAPKIYSNFACRIERNMHDEIIENIYHLKDDYVVISYFNNTKKDFASKQTAWMIKFKVLKDQLILKPAETIYFCKRTWEENYFGEVYEYWDSSTATYEYKMIYDIVEKKKIDQDEYIHSHGPDALYRIDKEVAKISFKIEIMNEKI